MKRKIFNKKTLLAGLAGLIVGVIALLGIRFATYSAPKQPHYHANFAVYINGEREQFKGFGYYEETAGERCTLHPVDSPKERAHMHDKVNDVVHVEDNLVTWGNFMQNLGWGLGDDYLKTADGMLINDANGSLHFILNGKPVKSVYDTIIGDKDKLLISYGTENNSDLQAQYKTIASTANKYDTSKDPASCGAGHTDVTTSERLKHLF